MDGNRRWAKKRLLPAALGHASGAKRVRAVVESCIRAQISHLSLFAFSTENWRRPQDEISVFYTKSLVAVLKDIYQKRPKLQRVFLYFEF